MSIQPHDVRELLGRQSGTAPVSDEQVERMVTVLNCHRATRGASLRQDDASAVGSPPVGRRPKAAPGRR
jgi:hypothetical protein